MKVMEIGLSEDAPKSAKETDKSESNSELIGRSEVKETPFTVIEIDGKYFGTMGMHRITEYFDSSEEVVDLLSKFSWNRVIQVMMLLSEQGIFNNDKKVEV